MNPPGAIILCGGKSSRMGRPKAWLPFGPEFLLQRVARLVASVCDPLVVVAAPGQELPTLSHEIRVVRDPVAYQGPLQGLAGGLAALPARSGFAYITATDVPFLSPAWVVRLGELVGDAAIALPFAGGYAQPLAALYRTDIVLPAARTLLARDRLRPAFLAEAVPTRIVSEDELRQVDPELGTLRNLNTPEEYERALRDAGY